MNKLERINTALNKRNVKLADEVEELKLLLKSSQDSCDNYSYAYNLRLESMIELQKQLKATTADLASAHQEIDRLKAQLENVELLHNDTMAWHIPIDPDLLKEITDAGYTDLHIGKRRESDTHYFSFDIDDFYLIEETGPEVWPDFWCRKTEKPEPVAEQKEEQTDRNCLNCNWYDSYCQNNDPCVNWDRWQPKDTEPRDWCFI